jgi:hypothetical protein
MIALRWELKVESPKLKEKTVENELRGGKGRVSDSPLQERLLVLRMSPKLDSRRGLRRG